MVEYTTKNVHREHWMLHRKLASWAGAILASLFLNIGLFSLLPGLVDRSIKQPETLEPISMINIVRIKRQDPPLKKPEKKPPEEKKIEPKKALLKRPTVQKDLIRTRVVPIPFALNPKLPPLPDALPTPDIKMVAVAPVDLKGNFGIGELDKPLTPLAMAPPIYPFKAKRRGIEGWVDVKFLVNKAGGVGKIEITDAHPPDIFNDNVRRCVAGWKFVPGTVDGVPVTVWAERRIRFKLE
jgi:protein TonB